MDYLTAVKLRDRCYKRLTKRAAEIDLHESYYRGKQPLTFATKEWLKANRERYKSFSDNWCGVVVHTEAERLDPIGITGIDKSHSTQLWDTLRFNNFDAQFSQGIITALATGRCFVSVWGDHNGEPIVSVEHPSQVEIEYGWEHRRSRTAALKTWQDTEFEFAVLYTPMWVYKWRRKRSSVFDTEAGKSQSEESKKDQLLASGWDMWQPPTDDTYPLQNPLGEVPIVEVGNRPNLLGEPLSEIASVIPLQDSINMLWAYLFLAADYASLPARVVLGASPPVVPIHDEKGTQIGERPVDMKDLSEKRMMFVNDPDAKISQWDAARLDVFTDTIEVAVGHIAAQTRTPPHYLVANKGISNISGDALTAAEIGLVQKANEFITFANPSLREVLRLVAAVLDDKTLTGSVRAAQVVWKNREIRSEAQLADALLKKRQIGYPFEFLLEKEGHDPATIARVMQMIDQEQAHTGQIGAVKELDDAATSALPDDSVSQEAADDTA